MAEVRRLVRPEAIPTRPGVYLFRDAQGRVIYVGKAKLLRNRLGNYFTSDLHARTYAMVEAAADLEWIVTDSEIEALHLELNLIKEHRPRYNVRYRDDKSYPYLAITVDEEFPRARVMRGPKRKGVKYYGPFAHAYAIRDTLDLLLRTFPMRTCSQGVFDRCHRRGRPCLLYHIQRCAGPCVGAVGPAEHRRIVMDLCEFLDGHSKPVLDRLDRAMGEAASRLEYEKAAKLRDEIDNVTKAIARQEMVTGESGEFDVVGLAQDDIEAAFQVFFVRRGRVTGRKGFIVDKVEDLDTPGLIGGFLERLYADSDIPKQVLVPAVPDNRELLDRWLSESRGASVRVKVPERGAKRALLETVNQNAQGAFEQHRLKRSNDFVARTRQLNELQSILSMDDAPLRIECYDISNTGPAEAVGSMVVFEDGLSKRSDYRRFAIKWTSGPDDVAMMGEVIRRRFARFLQESQAPADTDDLKRRRFAYPPNLVVIDGGKGQLGRAVEVMEDLGIERVSVIGLAKRMEEIYLPGHSDPLVIPRGSEALYLLQRVRDEAHRFANAYHALRRGKRMTQSALEGIPGLGPARRKKLLRHFGSVKRVREATLDDLRSVPGLPDAVAQAVYSELHGQPGDSNVRSAS
ncbi:MAG: excinuclease ABC subunit UvrC [Actinomycetota bacterium]|nr:excinuclease ABC subunit UvrC [Actinomycetota bacterium]